MYSANSRGLAVRGIILLTLLIAFGLAPLALRDVQATGKANTIAGLPALRGEAALTHLKERGLYASLNEAVRAANSSAALLPASDPLILESARLTAADGAAEDFFAAAVAISGNTAIVGAPRNDINTDADQGAAYIFRQSGGVWTQEAKLKAATGAAGDFFGGSVAIRGDTAIVGAYLADIGANANQGAAYVFTRSAGVWTQQDKLKAGAGAADDLFGFSVGLGDDVALIGAHLADAGGGANQGAAYVFTRSGGVWSEHQKLSAPDAAANDLFGLSLALDAGTAVIGASGKIERGDAGAGAAYAFTLSNGIWAVQQKLLPDISAAGNFFGAAVALSGDTALIGSVGDDIGANADQGSASIFVNCTGLSREQELIANNGLPGDGFGNAVAISGDTAVIGAPQNDLGGSTDQGSAYVFVRNGATWTQEQKLTASAGAAYDHFGNSVAISDDTAVIGAYRNDVGGNTDQGSAYVFVRNGGTWTQQQKLTDTGGGAAVAINGDLALVGALRRNGGRGAVYLFTRSDGTWAQQQMLTAANSFFFGQSAGISGDRAVVGARDIAAYVFACTACPAITLDPATLPNSTAGSPYNQLITATGGVGPYNYSVSSGTLPLGLTLDHATGGLSGTPTTAGRFRFTIMATEGSLCTGSRDYALVIDCPAIAVTPANPNLPPGTVGAAYNRAFTANGGRAPHGFSIGVGALPAGLSLDAATGILAGTPAIPGTFNFEVRATDSSGCTGSTGYVLRINCPQITVAPNNTNLPNGALGTA